jgi:phosphinothricin acetyltransferase
LEVNKDMPHEKTEKNYHFQEAKEEHLPRLLEIYNYYVMHSTATFHTKPFTREEMRGLLFYVKPLYRTFVLYSGDEICGYVTLGRHNNRDAYDTTGEVGIYLKPDCTGKGIGSIALKHIEGYAVQKGFHALIATITGENEQSIRLFRKNGYEKCAHYREVGKKFGRWLDVVAYEKLLIGEP